MKNYVAIFIFLVICIGCQKQENTKVLPVAQPILKNKENKKSTLETFNFPNEITGCGCYFAKNEEDFDAEKYIFVDEIEGKSYFKIGDDLIKLPITDDLINMDRLSKTIENSEYKITLNGERVKSEEEALIFKGKMKVLNKKTDQEFESSIIGECGC